MIKVECNHHVESFDPQDALENKEYPLSCRKLGATEGDYSFEYNYPLSKTAKFTHPITTDTDIITVLLLAQSDYKKIYAIEDAATGPTGYIPGMLNRARSEGPYGIWGHVLSDLFFERVTIDTVNKRVTFSIGS